MTTTVDGIDIRAAVPQGQEVIRSRLVQQVMLVLERAPFDPLDPLPDPIPLFEFVKRGNLEDISTNETPSAAIEEGAEERTELIYRKIDKRLRLYVHFKVVKVAGVDPEAVINYYFGRIAKLLVTVDEHFADDDGNELAFDIAEAGNSIQTIGSNDPEPGGTIYFDVDYRHARGDWMSE